MSRLGRSGRFVVTATVFAAAALAAAAPSPAKSPLSTTVTLREGVNQTCFARVLPSGPGVASRSVTSPVFGAVTVRLTAAGGNWDLGVFDAKTGRTVAGSAFYGAREIAEGPVQKDEPLVVQACRVSGPAVEARLSIGFRALPRHAPKAQLVRVSTPTREAKEKLQSLGLDLTEHGGKDFLSVVLHGSREAAKLGQAGFISVTDVEDLAAQGRRDRRAEAAWAREAPTAAFTCATPNCPIDIGDNPDFPATADHGATPYPSNISVAGLSGSVTKVTVTLTGYSHPFPDDVDVLLVGPTGVAVELMSDAGGGTDAVGAIVTFDDSAPAAMPDGAGAGTGTFKPSNYAGSDAGCAVEVPTMVTTDPFPAPAPAAPSGGYPQTMTTFNGTTPNGTWKLFVADDCNVDGGSIASWKLDITTGAGPTGGLPSGRTGPYRRIMEYTSEMNALVASNPTIAKRFTLGPNSYEGRPIEGIEISTNVNARDGKPVFLNMGLHHAREWPSSEHSLEWAYELINGYNANNPRVVNLLQTTRTLIIPIVNPDGFNASREFGESYGHGNGDTNNELLFPNEYRRKNCRINEAPTPTGNCAGPAFGAGSTGVDLNRNYGAFWGGPGSSPDTVSETFHGPHCANETSPATPVKGTGCGPFSEPETEAIRRLISTRHVMTLITNHTSSGLVLRAPGLASQGLAPDEPAMKALGDAMAVQNGYLSQYGWQLYDTTGTTEDWSYETTGGYGYTFEIGPDYFHPPYNEMIQEYDGTATWQAGRLNQGYTVPVDGNREAYFIAQENTANPVHHSVITGSAPVGAVLRLKKVVQTPTSIRDTNNVVKTFTDTLETTMVVPALGSYEWHINPSTRPLVTRNRGRAANCTTPPCVASPPLSFTGSAAGADPLPDPGGVATPCADDATTDPDCWNDHPFTIPTGANIDNALVAIRVGWTSPGSDWDMIVFEDSNGDGSSVGETNDVASSLQGTTAFEATSVGEPFPAANNKYVIRIINYAAAEPYTGTINFFGPEPFQPATTESWTLTCEIPEGNALSTQQVTINRGQQKIFNFTPTCGLAPTGVEVASFAARRVNGGVAVSWRTANERNITGFNVWRAGTKLNRVLVPARRSGTLAGATYRLVDRGARPGVTYTYSLQAVTRDGSRSWLRRVTVRGKR